MPKSLESYQKAIEYIDRYINENEDDFRAFLLKAVINGDILIKSKKSDEIQLPEKEKEKIMLDFNKSKEINENFSYFYNCRGNFYLNLGKIEDALKDYNKAIEIDSHSMLENQNKIFYTNRGDLYFGINDLENALKDYGRAIEIDTNYAVAYKRKGDIFTKLGKITEALKEYEKALKIDPNYEAAYNVFEKMSKPDAYYDILDANLHYDFQYILRYDSGKDHVKYGFPIKYNHLTDEPFEFALIEEKGRTILSDQGRTFKMLDEIFELREYDVSKNLARILKEFRVFKNGFDFSIEIIKAEEEKVLNEAKYRFFRCVSFMDKMQIFYNSEKFNPDESKFNIFNGPKSSRDTPIDTFSFPAEYFKSDIKYEFALVKKEGKYYLTDQGNTYKMLDKIFELREYDVQKNLHAIMQKCQVSQKEDEFLIEFNAWDENSKTEGNTDIIDEVKHRLLECVSFMDTMRIFYV
ncbi:hypothetical protein FACS189415_4760 [Bacteroidia bacterium]|nr:hypothetical protein FACS189426_07790 [Bacteroidia bacterium]GHU83109.1 hypothetical protein FACS189415_4760 [Bacteroidia bacterium]